MYSPSKSDKGNEDKFSANTLERRPRQTTAIKPWRSDWPVRMSLLIWENSSLGSKGKRQKAGMVSENRLRKGARPQDSTVWIDGFIGLMGNDLTYLTVLDAVVQ